MDAKGRLGTVKDALGRWTLWDARGTQGGRCSIERGRDGHATVTGRSRSRHKNVSITVKKPEMIFCQKSSRLKIIVVMFFSNGS